MLPIDVVVVKDGIRSVKRIDDLSPEDSIMDAGPETMAALKKKINASRSVLWNGPLGLYQDGYKQPTLDLAAMIADSGAQSVVGGGDTLAAIAELGIEDKLSFVSTGGGATLDFLANETLPGIEALKSNSIS
jgi:phosphoglycerate kinase